MRSTSVVAQDGGIADVEANVFCEQVLSQFDADDRAVIERVLERGKVLDMAVPMQRVRHRLFGRHTGMGWRRFRDYPRVAHVARKMGFI